MNPLHSSSSSSTPYFNTPSSNLGTKRELNNSHDQGVQNSKKVKKETPDKIKRLASDPAQFSPLSVSVEEGSTSQPLLDFSDSPRSKVKKTIKKAPWRNSILTAFDKEQIMVKTSEKAIAAHRAEEAVGSPSVYAPFPIANSSSSRTSISLTYQVAERQGRRATMEDAYLFQKIRGGYLVGIFDGHGGSLVSNYAKNRFSTNFSRAMKETNQDIHRSFEITIDRIQKEVTSKKEMKLMGSTMVVSFIQNDGTIVTATVGDSETFAYSKDEVGNIKSTPLSLVHNWADPEEAKRAEKLARTTTDAELRKKWPESTNPKMLRVRNHIGYVLNVSNALGDPTYIEVSHKPEITIGQLQPGYKVGFLCDGVTDFVKQNEIIALIKAATSESDLAATVADYALQEKGSTDNVTTLFLEVHKRK